MLNIKDKKLLFELDINSKQSNSQLAKKMRLSEQAVGYRIKNLISRGIIKNFITFINTSTLGYFHFKVFLRLQNINLQKESEFIDYLVNDNNIRWVVSTSGKYDISFSILAKNEAHFGEIFRRISANYSQYIIEKNIILLERAEGYTKAYLFPEKEPEHLKYIKAEIIELDNIDKKILKILSINARISLIDIGNQLKLSADTIKYRIKKLKEKGIIQNYTIQIDLEKIGYQYYSIFLYLQNFTKENEKKLEAYAKFNPNIIYYGKTIGNYDIQFEVNVRDYLELGNIVKDVREKFPDIIRNFETIMILKEYKYNFYPF